MNAMDTQVKTRPPTFALVANTREVDDSYVRFLKNKLQVRAAIPLSCFVGM